MNDELRNSFASLAPPIVASPAKRIQALTGDPDFMTSLARGLAVIHAFSGAQAATDHRANQPPHGNPQGGGASLFAYADQARLCDH